MNSTRTGSAFNNTKKMETIEVIFLSTIFMIYFVALHHCYRKISRSDSNNITLFRVKSVRVEPGIGAEAA